MNFWVTSVFKWFSAASAFAFCAASSPCNATDRRRVLLRLANTFLPASASWFCGDLVRLLPFAPAGLCVLSDAVF